MAFFHGNCECHNCEAELTSNHLVDKSTNMFHSDDPKMSCLSPVRKCATSPSIQARRSLKIRVMIAIHMPAVRCRCENDAYGFRDAPLHGEQRNPKGHDYINDYFDDFYCLFKTAKTTNRNLFHDLTQLCDAGTIQSYFSLNWSLLKPNQCLNSNKLQP